jgi:alkanesulfonate monooxygenase SsuD/methylene tetrahydromethanopterin reductase-like flavin-dependent oxidoreductase (luciferase family)
VKVGVLQFFSWPERRVPLETVYARALERIEVMDREGYDAVWLAEHHFSSYSVCPSVHLMGIHVAARTRRLRIGTAVSLAAFYHPLRLAEEVALLDVLSEGRVDWGAGRGFDPLEFRTFGVPVEESAARFRETVEVVLAAWTHERLTWKGECFAFDDVEVLPKPRQRPHPPTWVAASSPPAIEWAASRGLDILMDPHSSHADIAAKHALYRRGLAAHAHRVEGRVTPMARLLAVAESAAEAETVARRGAQWTLSSYFNPQHMPGLRPGAAPFGGGEARGPVDPVERYLDGVIVYGTPGSVLDELERLREEMGLHYLLCAPLGHRSFELFTREVLPHLV